MESVTRKIFITGLVSILIIIALLFGRLIFYSNEEYLNLPYESTLASVSLKVDSSMPSFTALTSKMGLVNTLFLAQLENIYFPEFATTNFQLIDLKNKLLTLQVVDNQIYPVMIYTFRKEIESSIGKKIYYKNNIFFYQNGTNRIIVSNNLSAIQQLIKPNRSIKTILEVHDVVANLPKFTILNFYLNHQLLEPFLDHKFVNLNRSFFHTAGALKESTAGLIFSTYSSPNKNIIFPYTRQKYSPYIAKNISDETVFFLGGQNSPARILSLLKNSPKYNQDTNVITNEIQSILNGYNLSSNALELLVQILKSEFALSIDDQNNIAFIFQALNDQNEEKLLVEVEKLGQSFNSIKTPYKLEDGTNSFLLKPNPAYTPKTVFEHTYFHDFTNIGLQFIYSHRNDNKLNYFTKSKNPFVSENFLSEDKFFKLSTNLLLPIADELLMIKKSFWKNTNPLIPNFTVATNYFHDGIQTVTFMQW